MITKENDFIEIFQHKNPTYTVNLKLWYSLGSLIDRKT